MSFFNELKRRNVVRVGLAYAAIGWVLAQVAEFAFENFGAPDWVLRSFVVLLVLGLPLALFFAWAFELTPEGIKRERDVDRSESITRQTGRRIDRLIIVVLVAAVAILLTKELYFDQTDKPGSDVVATTGHKSIAVLPFVNMSGDEDHFSDGLSEELLNLLAKSPDLKVAGRTSSFAFKGRNEDLREIGDALGVEHVLEGSVRRSGERLRITAQLIKVDDGFHLWSETYDREMADIFDIQDDVAGAIASALKLQLSPVSVRSTNNPEAYSLYLQALAFRTATVADGPREAQQLLSQAIGLDPDFARAYELKAIYHWFEAGWSMEGPRAQKLAYAAAMKALELDPTLVAARSFAQTAKPDWNWIDEIAALEELRRIDPHAVLLAESLTWDLLVSGYFEEALAVAESIIEAEPLSAVGYWRKAEALRTLGRHEEAMDVWRYLVEEFDEDVGREGLMVEALLRGDDLEAVKWLEVLWSSLGKDPAGAAAFIRNVRDPVDGKRYLDDWIASEVAAANNLDEQRRPYGWYLILGYIDDYWAAIRRLNRDEGRGWTSSDTLEHFGMMIRETGFARHPEYLRRANAQGLTDLWDQRGAPDHCNKASGEWVCE